MSLEKDWKIPDEKIEALREFLLSQGGTEQDHSFRVRGGVAWTVYISGVGTFTMFKKTVRWDNSVQGTISENWPLSSFISDSIERNFRLRGRWKSRKELEKVLTMSRDEFRHWEKAPKEEHVTMVVVDDDDPFFIPNLLNELAGWMPLPDDRPERIKLYKKFPYY